MTGTAHAVIPLTEIPVSEGEQARADILESNLFSTLVHVPETAGVTIATATAPGEEKTSALALLQILQRFHLETVKLSALVVQAVLAKAPFHESMYVPWDDEGRGRTITLTSENNALSLTVAGTLPENGKNGQLVRTFFDQGTGAGKILSDGRIDFRELHRYPAAKPGELLLRVSLPEPEKNGLSHDGTTIQANSAKEYPIKLGTNVEKTYVTTEDGRPAYDVKALREGVIITRMEQKNIVSIDVSDVIVVGDIDFSVGNIGSEATCPVSVQAQSVHEGFTVKVAGSVSLRTINGGKVESGKNAEVDQMRPGSRLTTHRDASCRSVSASTIRAENGTVSITREAIDATITARRVEMNTMASLLLNTRITTCALDLKNVRVSGLNRVVLCPGLFAMRNELITQKSRVKAALHEAEEHLNNTKTILVGELKSLAAEFGEDAAIRLIFRKVVEALKAYDFEEVVPLMTSLKRAHTCLAVNGALRTIELLKRRLHKFWEFETRLKDVEGEIEAVDKQLQSVTFSITASLRPSAVIEIHLGNKDTSPLVLVPPPNKQRDHALHIKGHFTLRSGLVISERSG